MRRLRRACCCLRRSRVPSPMWPIKRTTPIGLTYGFAIPAFINNWQYHLVTVDVYSDGAIDAWGVIDRNLFEQKLRQGWIWPQPPDGGRISVHNLGACDCTNSKWLLSREVFRELIHDRIRTLNPNMANLIDMKGSDTEIRGKVKYAKLSLPNKRPYRRAPNGSDIEGKCIPAFLKLDGTSYRLTNLFIYSDGQTTIGSDGQPAAADSLLGAIESGQLTTSVSDDSEVVVDGLGSFSPANGRWRIKPSERIREIQGLFAEFRGEPHPVQGCRRAFDEHVKAPSAESIAKLRTSYEAVPEHLRMYCGDMDSKDYPIRRIIYGDGK
jgi:hypothetical protein